MSTKKLITGLTLSLVLASMSVGAADNHLGIIAYQEGDYATAFSELSPLAEQGDEGAQLYLGVMYAFGKGVLEDDKTAVYWYIKAAEQGSVNAQFNLGVAYDDGKGVLENDKTAFYWYTKAAEQGDADAQYNIGVMYAYGEGVPENIRSGYMWFNLASYNGHEGSSEAKKIIAEDMTPAEISEAQDMFSRCLESYYTDC